MKTYVLIVSEKFPATHKRAGESTYFPGKILDGIKIHTIRGNYDLWAKRVDAINKGEAVLSVRHWYEKPYRSPQIEFTEFDEIGIEKLEFREIHFSPIIVNGDCYARPHPHKLAKNDGLSIEDFEEWFKYYDKTEPMAIIHFTNFRYL
jgi:hypothetical protein